MVIGVVVSVPGRVSPLLRGWARGVDSERLRGDGGAWVSTYAFKRQTLQRVSPNGSVRTASPNAWARDVTLGPDGQAWFIAGPGIVRVDAAGNASPIAVAGIGQAISTGPDGTAWAPSSGREQRLLRIGPDGAVTDAPLTVSPCATGSGPARSRRATVAPRRLQP